MYILYIDESGDPSPNNSQNHLVLGGIAVFEGEIYKLTTALDDIQEKIFPGIRAPIELHAQHIHDGKGRFRSLTDSERESLMANIYRVIANANWPGLIAFATAVHVSAVSSYDELRPRAFEDMCQRFNTFLVREYKFGTPQKGLLVVDRSHSEKQYLQLIARFRQEGTTYGYLGNVVDIPYFTDSHNTRMMQLADFCAYAVYRYYEESDPSYLNVIRPRFDKRTSTGLPDGFKYIRDPARG